MSERVRRAEDTAGQPPPRLRRRAGVLGAGCAAAVILAHAPFAVAGATSPRPDPDRAAATGSGSPAPDPVPRLAQASRPVSPASTGESESPSVNVQIPEAVTPRSTVVVPTPMTPSTGTEPATRARATAPLPVTHVPQDRRRGDAQRAGIRHSAAFDLRRLREHLAQLQASASLAIGSAATAAPVRRNGLLLLLGAGLLLVLAGVSMTFARVLWRWHEEWLA